MSTIFVVFVLTFATYNGIRYLYKPYETEVAYEQTVSDKLKVKAVLVRSESLLPIEKQQNILGYTVDDGEVVIEKTIVAKIHEDSSDLKGIAKAEALAKKIDTLKKAESSVVTLRKIETVSAQINKTIGNLVMAVNTYDMSKLSEIYSNLEFQMAKRSIMNGNPNFSGRINHLNAQMESELAAINEGEKISCQMSGYFSSYTDGLESTLSPQNLKQMTFDEIKSVVNDEEKSKATNFVGKVMTDHNWSIAIISDYEKISELYVGKKVMMDFKTKNCREIPAVISKIIPDKDRKNAAFIFDCNYVNPFILSERHSTVEINSKTFTGLKISQRALRFLNGKEGVYVIEGGVAVFKSIDVIYKTDKNVLCSTKSAKNNLRIFDEVIVSGKDIYNGKIIESYTK